MAEASGFHEEMRIHPRAHFFGDGFALLFRHVQRIGFPRTDQISMQMAEHLPGQRVEQTDLGQGVVVVEVHRRMHDVLLQALFRALGRLPAQPAPILREWLQAGCDLVLEWHDDAQDVEVPLCQVLRGAGVERSMENRGLRKADYPV